ncbi:hypothetical protein ACIGHG_15720 [Bacillus sp. NPDC077411]|uniref:hypothetical protein n=1 Tax=Bacillus sp. NPDC077411 TaxID=3363947 RepID=UPI0037C8FDE2
MGEEETKFQILHDHYKDTFALQREYLKLRDRLFIYTLLVFAAMFILIIVPVDPSKAVSDIVKEQLKVKLSINSDAIHTMLWFGLLCLVVRYFQTNIVVERQYDYIHEVEEELNSSYDPEGNMFTREGKSYLNNFQSFSTLAGYLYILVFPMLLIIVTSYKLYTEVMGKASFDVTLILDAVFWVLIFVYTIVYSISLHFKKIKKIWLKVKSTWIRVRNRYLSS